MDIANSKLNHDQRLNEQHFEFDEQTETDKNDDLGKDDI